MRRPCARQEALERHAAFISISVAPVTRTIAKAEAVGRLIAAMLPHYAAPEPCSWRELLASTLYARHRAERDGTASVGRAAFVSDLVDALTALVLGRP